MRHTYVIVYVIIGVFLPVYCDPSDVTRMDQSGGRTERCPAPCTCTDNLKVVNCVRRDLTQIPADLPGAATTLYLGYNSVSRVQAGQLDHVTNLTRLDINNNYLIHVEAGAFRGLANLTRLSLTGNMLAGLPAGLFTDLPRLQTLYLGQNKLITIPDLTGATLLTRLILDSNQLTSFTFPPGFKVMTSLASVNAANNPGIKSLTAADFANLAADKLANIGLSRCGISEVGDATFAGFTHLHTLKLAANPMTMTALRAVLDSLSTSRELGILDISSIITAPISPAFLRGLQGAALTQLTMKNSRGLSALENGTFSCCPLLEKLYLSDSELTFAEEGAFAGTSLSTLDLSGASMLQKIPTSLPPSLTTLNLAGCGNIKQVSSRTFLGLGSVSHLRLDACNIQQLQNGAFLGLYNLTTLLLSNNKIPSFGAKVFEPLKNLETLRLDNNKLVLIRGDTSKLFSSQTKLRLLDMSGNSLEQLPANLDTFHPLVNLEIFHLHGNNLGETVARDTQGTLLHNKPSLLNLTLNNNNIRELPVQFLSGLRNASNIRLENNRITGWDALLFNRSGSNLKVNLTNNQITVVNRTSVLGLSPHMTFDLSGNPFACSCDLIWFRKWINDTTAGDRVTFSDLDTYRCKTPASMSRRRVLEFDPEVIWSDCYPPPWMLIIIGVSVAVLLIFAAIATALYRQRWAIKLWCYHRYYGKQGKYKPLSSEEEYDVMISYDDVNDRKWVLYQLYERLDARRKGDFKTFVEEVDIHYGHVGITASADAMFNSKTILLILSDSYFRSARHKYEIDVALKSRAEIKRPLASIQMVLLCPEEVAVKYLPRCLHSNIDEDLTWDREGTRQEVFWNKLQQIIQAEHQDIE